MSDTPNSSVAAPEHWEHEQYCYLTTTGRRTGEPHEIEIWFAVEDGRIYLLSGRGERADWVKNLRLEPRVTVRVGGDIREAIARVIDDGGGHPARRSLAAKYRGWEEGQPLTGWAVEAVLVEVSLQDPLEAEHK